MMRPILSIVVPTKNRYKYLTFLIELVEGFNSSEVELVIHDNSDDNTAILDYLEGKKLTSLRYFYSKEKLSMSGNSDEAVKSSTGEYVCFIGDDDGVCRNIIDCVHWMRINGIDAIKPAKSVYYWGDYNKQALKEDLSQTLLHTDFKSNYEIVDPIKELEKSLSIGFQDKRDLPFLYTGIVKRSVLDEVYSIGGTFFPGGSPDISNGVNLCFKLEKYVVVDAPVVITGISNMTGGGIHKRRGKVSELSNVGFIDKKVVENWEEKIPKIWAGRLAWPESAIKGLRYAGHPEFLSEMNYDYMLANFAIYHSDYFMLALEYAPNKFFFFYYIIKILFLTSLRVGKNKIVALFRKRTNGFNRINGVTNILEAEEIIMKQYMNKPLFK